MGTINRPNTYTANTVISPSQVNDDFDTIYNEFNGSISAANLATGAVTTAKIADDAVTADKLADSSVTYAQLTSTLLSGWIDANETWTYASGTGTNVGTFTITGDKTSKYQAGDRIQFTQTTVKYAIITKVSYSNPSTTVTIYMGTDYTIANAAISANYYSKVKSPQGFPIDPAKWTITTTSSSDRTTTSSTFASLTDTLVVPIGCWDIRAKYPMLVSVTGTSALLGVVTLSSDASTETNPQLSGVMRSRDASAAASSNAGGTCQVSSTVTLTSSTTFTLMGKTNAGTLDVQGSTQTPIVLRAVCAYL